MPTPSTIIGNLDALDGDVLRGWVFDRRRPDRRLTVDIFAGPLFLGQATAGFERPDLEAHGFGDGRLQFLATLPAPAGTTIADLVVRVARHPEVRLTQNGAVDDAVDPDADAMTGLRALAAPLVAAFATETDDTRPVGRSTDPRLSEASIVGGVPMSAFALHVARKFGWADPATWTPDDAWRFMHWYALDYAVAQAPRRPPMSAAEIAFWSAAGGAGTCRAAQHWSPRPRCSSRVAAYNWAVEDSRRLFVEDVFVDGALARRLSAIPIAGAWQRAFPLSVFMRRFLAQTARLRGLPTRSAAQRQLVYAAIMLHALRAPHLLTYLPSRWLAAMVDGAAGSAPFDNVLGTLLGHPSPLSAQGYRAALARRGYDIDRQGWRGVSARGAAIVDVQIVGPFRRTLGLGESCRRIAGALSQCGVSLSCVDYDLGNASATQPLDIPLQAIARSRITLLHLNLEEIPEALAFRSDPASLGHLIAFPYVELNAVAASHRLGLSLVRELWTASEFLTTTFRPACPATHRIGMPIDPGLPSRLVAEGPRHLAGQTYDARDVVFLATSDALSWVQRKNVVGALDAFEAAFPGEPRARLIVKTHNLAAVRDPRQTAIWARIADRVARDDRVRLVDETMDAEAYRDLLSGVDCLVSLHRAEGLGLDILDAMTMGTAVVATAYSGNADICTPDTCWPVGFDLVPVAPGDYAFAEPGHVWAEPCHAEAVDALQQVLRYPEERAARARRARRRVATRNAPDAVAAAMVARLRALGLRAELTPSSAPDPATSREAREASARLGSAGSSP